ncbi:uncharacterized protein E0L32_001840 [Thyridium curvatum]|uniref:DUF6594 domain-containing protein n=1 Tax=Thyridium curvatum TaxID=1093900 RepID=A0A507AP76_9PEZI|nr:uncharacterized protein E0L32_001839 [Thyridium curvatum]XP_030989976.1 uncharacterized protein E0L32_001840 [Thyridium curvatum]TPX08264.1 hypothetical protein E0L32_001839 [Thyridium curvatum]TPX08265.1 hypothetical protein E0L32_001840 [Thyridium curvatum]
MSMSLQDLSSTHEPNSDTRTHLPKISKSRVDAPGLPSLASFMASDPDGTASIFKRFNRLAARNLLALQSELAELQSRLDRYDEEDKLTAETMQSLRNWQDYKARAADQPERMELMSEIKSVMKEYREALLCEHRLACIQPPERKTLKAFRSTFYTDGPGFREPFPLLGGSSASLYDDSNDLVALQSVSSPDRLTTFVQNQFGFLFQENVHDNGSGVPTVAYASARKLATFITYLSTFLATLLLFGAILILYKAKSDSVKLGLIALFTLLFAASIGLLTNGKRSEVFASTAAYAAVLVVFVSGDLGSSKG